MNSKKLISILEKHLKNEESKVFAIIDGAAVNNLLDKIFLNSEIKYECLNLGELTPDIAQVSPYLIEFNIHSKFADWIYSGWGKGWSIFLISNECGDIKQMRRELRSLTLSYGPHNQPLYFRWYDPRVLRVVLPVLVERQLKEIFNSVHKFVLEDVEYESGKIFSLDRGRLSTQTMHLE